MVSQDRQLLPVKADLAIHSPVSGISACVVAFMLSYKWDISILVPLGMVFANPVTYIHHTCISYTAKHLRQFFTQLQMFYNK